jgi:hypothetical protein
MFIKHTHGMRVEGIFFFLHFLMIIVGLGLDYGLNDLNDFFINTKINFY